MSCNKGIFRIAKAELDAFDRGERRVLQCVAYGTRDGMRNRECNGANQPAGWRTADGRLWFPTIEGLVEIDPERLATNPMPPPVVVEQLVVDGATVAPRDGLELGPGTDSLELQYAGLSFGAPERMRFRYRLEGFDRDWVEAGTRRSAYYTRIPHGRYRFHVAAANEDGVWNEAGRTLAFRIRPRFHHTPAFYALSTAAVLAAVIGGHRLRLRGLRRREERLVGLVEQRTAELAEANRRLERLSSLDGLTGVANRRRFDEALDVEWRRALRAGSPLSLVLLDIDHFKAFNDTYGHLRGDECLQQVALALSASLGRAGDLLARYGGEEFVALLPDTPAADAGRRAHGREAARPGGGAGAGARELGHLRRRHRQRGRGHGRPGRRRRSRAAGRGRGPRAVPGEARRAQPQRGRRRAAATGLAGC
jgi:GGDEF domain-containing protein